MRPVILQSKKGFRNVTTPKHASHHNGIFLYTSIGSYKKELAQIFEMSWKSKIVNGGLRFQFGLTHLTSDKKLQFCIISLKRGPYSVLHTKNTVRGVLSFHPMLSHIRLNQIVRLQFFFHKLTYHFLLFTVIFIIIFCLKIYENENRNGEFTLFCTRRGMLLNRGETVCKM